MRDDHANEVVAKQPDAARAAKSEAYLRSLKPHFEGLPDYGLMLSPEDEAELRAYAQANGIDFDEMKHRFEISHQVIPARQPGYIRNMHHQNRVIPLNDLRDSFHGWLSGEICWLKWQAEIAAEKDQNSP